MRNYALEAESLSEEELKKKYAELCEAYDKMSNDVLYLHGQISALKKELSELSVDSKKCARKGNNDR